MGAIGNPLFPQKKHFDEGPVALPPYIKGLSEVCPLHVAQNCDEKEVPHSFFLQT